MENQEDSQDGGAGSSMFDMLKYFVLLAIFLYAIYLSFRCKGGFQFGDFFAAFCCSPCYVAYRLAVGC
jgi:hypothetical protein